MARLGRSRPASAYKTVNGLNPLDSSFTVSSAVQFNPSVSASVTVADPVIATAAVSFNPSVSASVESLSASAATVFSPSVSAAVTVLNPVTSTVAADFNPAVSASAYIPIKATVAAKFSPSVSATVGGGEPPRYTNNYHPNPAFQNGLEGYSATETAVINLDTSNILYGPASLLVTCPGEQAGEGCRTPSSVIPATSTGSASFYINGTGKVTATVWVDGVQFGVQHLQLERQWVRLIIQDLAYLDSSVVYLTIEATVIDYCQFWCSGFQVEDTSPCHPYCDGDRDGCYWESGFYGASYCLYINPVIASAAQHTSTAVVNILDVGEAFYAQVYPAIQRTYNSLVYPGSAGPLSAVTDFAVAALTDPDPAQTYVSWNNSGVTMSGSYSQSWATFIPPADYLVSNGDVLYSRGAFMTLGWDFQSATENEYAQITRSYAGLSPLPGSNTAPVFDNPRSIHTIIIADRINFVTNPSFEISTANWSAVGAATLTRDGTVNVGEIALYDETIITTGSYSCNVTLNENFDGLSVTVPDLLPGYTYIASAYVKSGLGLNNIVMSIADGITSVQSSGGTGYNVGTYNAGPYGGFNPAGDLPESTWYRIWCIFTASGDSETLTITSAPSEDVSYPTHMWVDGVLIEQGEILQGYFDGSVGINYTWDSQSGTPGLSRSYYYSQMQVKQQAVSNVLSRHTPLGISYAPPVYSVPPVS
jgi:hypothetical protein